MKKKRTWLAWEGGGVKGADGSSESNSGEGGTKQYWGKDYAPGVGRAATNLLRSLWTIDLGSPVSVSSFINFALRKLWHFWPWNKLCLCVSLCVQTQSCLTLCDPMDCSMPGFSVLGIFQEGILEWVAISFLHIPGDLPNPGIKPRSPSLTGVYFTPSTTKRS